MPRELDGRRLDEILQSVFPEHSRARLQKLVRRGEVRLDGRRVRRSNVCARRGQRLELGGDPPPEPPTHPSLRFVHMDEHLAVVDKPAGLAMYPAERVQGATLAELLADELGALPEGHGAERAGIVHRLDRGTSGLCVVARTDAAMSALRAAFRAREVEKRYLAYVLGRPSWSTHTTEQPLAADPRALDRQRVDPRGKPARTQLAVLCACEHAASIEARPESGRRHQIRVHLAALGLPLVSDRMYRRKDASRLPVEAPRPSRPALHAAGLRLRHPASGVELQLEAPLPEDLRELDDWLRARAD